MKQYFLIGMMILACLSANILVAQSKGKRSSERLFGFEFGFTGVIGFGTPFTSEFVAVKDFPEYLRYVPIHKDDIYKVPLQDNQPVMDDRIECSFRHDAVHYYGLVFQFRLSRLRIRFDIDIFPGLVLSSERYKKRDPFADEMRRRDYLLNPGSSDRETGSAHIYYAPYYETYKNPFFPRTEIELLLKQIKETQDSKWSINLLAGYTKDSCELGVEQGWDRWNRLELYKRWVLEKDTQELIYTGIVFKMEEKKKKGMEQVFNFYLITSLSRSLQQNRLFDDIGIEYRKIPAFIEVGVRFNFLYRLV